MEDQTLERNMSQRCRHFREKYTQTVSKHIKKKLFKLTLNRRNAKSNYTRMLFFICQVGRIQKFDSRNGHSRELRWESKMIRLHGGKSGILNKTVHLLFELAIILVGIYPETHFHKYEPLVIRLFIVMLFIVRRHQSQLKCSFIEDMVDNVWYSRTREYTQCNTE